MVIRSVNLETVCGVTSTLPVHSLPEFAFAGKSNVGKSTLINGLMRRKSYAHTSGNPGKTQTMSTAIYAAVQANDYDLAFDWALVIVVFSLDFVLLMKWWIARSNKGAAIWN